jgi:hypothetical protein
MAGMGKIIAAVIGTTVSIIIIGTVLVPQVTSMTAEGAALAEYAGLLSAIVVISIVGCLMLAVSLISRRD